MGNIDDKKRLKRDSLLESAFSLFTSKGINKTSISDIAENSGIAKGTFYLYFKDKYDLRNMLISHKASQLFHNADVALEKTGIEDLSEKIVFLVNHILDQLYENKMLLTFISKNLSWGIFKNVLVNPSAEDIDFYDIYERLLHNPDYHIDNPELMVFMIIELVGSTCYSSILYDEPVSLEELKPYLFDTIRDIINRHTSRKQPHQL